jgi:hypothetical protein
MPLQPRASVLACGHPWKIYDFIDTTDNFLHQCLAISLFLQQPITYEEGMHIVNLSQLVIH